MRRRILDRFLVIIAVLLIVSVVVILLAQRRNDIDTLQKVSSDADNVNFNYLADVLYDRHMSPDQIPYSASESSPPTTPPSISQGESLLNETNVSEEPATTLPTSNSTPSTAALKQEKTLPEGWETCDLLMYCTAESGLYIRREPTISAPISGVLIYGRAVKVCALSDEWAAFNGADGSYLFLFRSYLSKNRPPPTTRSAAKDVWTSCDTIYYVNSKAGLNLRSAPNMDASVIRAARNGEALRVVAKSLEWSKILLSDGKTAYAFSVYLTDVPPKTVPTTIKPTTTTTTTTTTKTTTTTTVNIHEGSVRLYSFDFFMKRGVIRWQSKVFYYYPQSVLPGYGLKIPGRHVNQDGYIADKDGYIVLAANLEYHRRGDVITTPFGYSGKIYDAFYPENPQAFDVYVDY